MEYLKCKKCDNYLSKAPVYLRHSDGISLCKTCAVHDMLPVIRNTCYEIVAQFLQFPCKYDKYGCNVTVSFNPIIHQEIPHELDCKYKAYVCQIGNCSWTGPAYNLHLHFISEHPHHLMDSPCAMKHNIQKSNIQTYLIPACNELFWLRAEVRLEEDAIYHSVLYFGKNTRASDYKFELLIEQDDLYTSSYGNVIPMANDIVVDETTAVFNKLCNLCDFFQGYENTKFTITIKSAPEFQDNVQEANCTFCNRWEYVEQGVCNNCRLHMQSCQMKPNGCTKINLFNKMDKHETFYCNYVNWCEVCEDYIFHGPISNHYLTKHTTHELGTYVNIRRTHGQHKPLLFHCEYGIICCYYYLSSRKMEIQVMTPLLNKDLRNLQCTIFIENLNTGYTCDYDLEFNHIAFYDWMLFLEKEEFAPWDNNFNIKIVLEKNQ